MTDEDRDFEREKRRRKHLERLGFENPKCLYCPEKDVRALQLDHIAGRAYSDDVWVVCSNCHLKRTDIQKDHPPKVAPVDNQLEITGRFLLGVADFFEFLIKRFREDGETLINMAAA
jgi:hypothetical protein